MSQKALNINDLIDVKFKKIDETTSMNHLIAKTERYRCAVTYDILNNSTPVAVLATSYVINLILLVITIYIVFHHFSLSSSYHLPFLIHFVIDSA